MLCSDSGLLVYRELFSGSPPAESCPSPGPAGTVLGYPACVYGFFMYLAIAGVAALGLRGKRKRIDRRSPHTVTRSMGA